MKLCDQFIFPVTATITDGVPVGLTIRQYFTALAMQGQLSAGSAVIDPSYKAIAAHAVKYADALIAALEEKKA